MKKPMLKAPSWPVALVLATGLAQQASASEVGDRKAYQELRIAYIRAAETNNPSAIGKLITDDFVYLQPNKNGPDTYGKSFHLEYRKSLRQLVNLEVEPIRVMSCGNDWALEIGREHGTWKSESGEIKTLARYFKLLNRTPDNGWQYSRIIMGWDEKADMPPPAPEFISNGGYGTWKPRPQGSEASALISDVDTAVKEFSEKNDLVTPMIGQLAPSDETTGELIALGPWGEIYGEDDYMADRRMANYQLDDLRKMVEEVIVCESGMAFSWGQDSYSGVDFDTAARWIGGGDFLYMHRFHEGKWKVGPHGTSYDEWVCQ